MIFTPVNVVEVLTDLSRSVVSTVGFVNTTGIVVGTLASGVNNVLSTVLTVFHLAVVFWCLEIAATLVGVALFEVFTVVEDFFGILEDTELTECLDVVLSDIVGAVVRFGVLVVRAVLFLKVLFAVRFFFRFVKVVTLLRVGVLVFGAGEVDGWMCLFGSKEKKGRKVGNK